MSSDKRLSNSSASAVAVGYSLRTITIIVAALVGLAMVFVFTTGGGKNVAHAATTIHVKTSTLSGHDCDADEWHFVINQIATAGQAPASIHVTWANGSSEDVPLATYTGKVGHYITTSNLDSTVTDATASIYNGWPGQFNLSHGPCGGETTPPSSPPPSS